MEKQTKIKEQKAEKAALLSGLLAGLKLQGRLLMLASEHKGASLSSQDMDCLGHYIANQAFIIEQGFIVTEL